MKNLRSIGMFLFVGAAICFVIAADFYYSAVSTSKLIAESWEGVEFESVGIPLETKIAALLGVALAVAGVRCWGEFLREKRNSSPPSGLLKDSQRA